MDHRKQLNCILSVKKNHPWKSASNPTLCRRIRPTPAASVNLEPGSSFVPRTRSLPLAGEHLLLSPLLRHYESITSPSRSNALGPIVVPICTVSLLSLPSLSPLPSLPSLAAPHTLPDSRSIKGGSPIYIK